MNSCSLSIYTFNVLLMSKAESDLQLRYLVMQLMMKLTEACVSSAILLLCKLRGVLLLTSVTAVSLMVSNSEFSNLEPF